MVYYDREFDGWRTTYCGLYHFIFETKEEAEKKEKKLLTNSSKYDIITIVN